MAVQEALNRTTSSPALKPDGAFGLKTDAAVRAFQRSRNLKADGIVGPRTAAALGLGYTARVIIAPTPSIGPSPERPRRPHETPALPGPSSENAIAQLVEAVIQGLTEIRNGVLGIVNSLDELPDVVAGEIRAALSGPFQAAIGILRDSVRAAMANIAAAAAVIAGAIRGAVQRVISALQTVLAFLSRLLGLDAIADRIRSIITRLQRTVEGVIDIILKTLAGAGRSVFEAAAAIAGLLRQAADV